MQPPMKKIFSILALAAFAAVLIVTLPHSGKAQINASPTPTARQLSSLLLQKSSTDAAQYVFACYDTSATNGVLIGTNLANLVIVQIGSTNYAGITTNRAFLSGTG